VDEAESLVLVLSEDVPRSPFICRRDPNNRDTGLVQQAESELSGRLIPQSHSEQGEGFVHDKIAGRQEAVPGCDVANGGLMEPIGFTARAKNADVSMKTDFRKGWAEGLKASHASRCHAPR
jgi:hypothetical protein